MFLEKIKKKLIYHRKNCKYYKNFIDNSNIKIRNIKKKEDIPFLHINLFKNYNLLSCKMKSVVTCLHSSGTSGNTSKIFLNKKNSIEQKKTLKTILVNEFGHERLPFLIIDKNPKDIKFKDKVYSAKMAAILGFSLIGKNFTYLLDNNGKIDYKIFNEFLKKYCKDEFLIFGFTSEVFKILYKDIKLKKINYSLKNSILIHGGGWKKLEKIKINNTAFKLKLKIKLKIKKIINYYGFVEQTGSIFLECPEQGYFHTNKFTDIFVRDGNLKLTEPFEKGVLQSISLIPSSYPGNSILLEDQATFYGNKCSCGRKGKIFKINERLNKAEVRGCSNVS